MDRAGELDFRQIAGQVKEAIISGQYPPASALPPEPELAAQFGVSRSLVNRAMQVLAAEGLVRGKRGRGTMVTWLPPMLHSPARYSQSIRERAGARGAFDAEVKALGLEPKHEIATEIAEAPAEIAATLGLVVGHVNAVVRRRRLLASGIPVRVNASWFPLDIAQETPLQDASAVLVGGVKTTLAELGYEQSHAVERLQVRQPSEPESRALEISPERSVLDIYHIGQMADGRAVEVTTTVTPAHYLIVENDFALN